MDGVVLGKRYPLHSLLKRSGDYSVPTEDAILTTLQYIFKPSSVDVNRSGSLALSESNEVLITLPILDNEGDTESFKGIATKPLNECILSFHSDHFSVEKVSSTITNIRHCRNESTFSSKDSTICDARKFHEKTLLMRAGARPQKKRKTMKADNSKNSLAEPPNVADTVSEEAKVDAVAAVLTERDNVSSGLKLDSTIS